MKTPSSRTGGTPPRKPRKAAPKPQKAAVKPLPKRKPPTRFTYDVCVSFAGEDRVFVERAVRSLKQRRVTCFYDRDEQADLLGKNLITFLDEVYRKKARHCLMFISKHYPLKQWTNHERESIQARVFEGGVDYLIPVLLDDTEVPGVLPTIGRIDGRQNDPSQVAALIQTKLRGKAKPRKRTIKPATPTGRRVNWTHMTVMRKLRKALNDAVIIALLDQMAARPGQIISFGDLLRHAGVTEARRGMTSLGVLTKIIKREFDLAPEKMSLPYERPASSDGSVQSSYRMLPEVAQAWLKSGA